MKYFISIYLILSVGLAYGQEPDSLEAEYKPTGIRLGIDAFSLGLTIADENINSTLFVADMDFYRYFLVLEYGLYERTRIGESGRYHTDGSYWRIGADVNFFHNDPDKSVFSVGVRYSNSTFDDRLNTTIGSKVYGDQEVEFQNSGVKADWYELVLGLKVPVWKIWLGYNMRLKLGIDSFEDMNFSPYEVPGYGLAAEGDYWEFNYYVMYRIQWKERGR